MNNQKKEWRYELGLVLCICGISLGGLLKTILGINNSMISIFIAFISIWLLFDLNNFKELRFLPKSVFFVFLYSAYTIVLALFSRAGIWESTVGIIYQLAYFLQIVLLWSVKDKFDTKKFQSINFWICGLASCVALLIIVQHGSVNSLGVLMPETDTARQVSRATTALIAFCGLTATLVYAKKNLFGQICKIVFSICAIAVLLISTRRSALIAGIVCVILYFRNRWANRITNRKVFLNILGALIAAVVLFAIVHKTNTMVQEVINRGLESVTKGLRAYIGVDYDMAVSYRRARIETIPNEYLYNSTVMQFLFGRGYNTDWLDVPFLQAFWDMGLLGGIWFLLIQGIIPFTHVLRKTSNGALLWARFGVVLTIVQNFANGTPYGGFIYIIAMYMFENSEETGEWRGEPYEDSTY